jgi:hypothetical protein
MNNEGDGDDRGDASDGGTAIPKDPRKAKDARDSARTIPQKQDEQDALGSPGRTSLAQAYRRAVGDSRIESSRGAGHVKRKGKNRR